MPWHIEKSSSCSNNKPFAVIKDSDNSVAGCHTTREKAESQLAALYASEAKESTMDENQEKEVMEVKAGVVSFEELESVEAARDAVWKVFDLADNFSMMVRNIYSDATVDSQSALNRLVSEFQTRVEKAVNPNIKELKIPQDLKPTSPIEHEKDTNEFVLFKSDAGQWRWFAIYSNMYRDVDHPPEIISSKSHEAFTSLVDAGVIEYPELWQWHIEGSRWGKADWLSYADGFAMAAGYIDKGFEFVAKGFANLDGDTRVSHGMPIGTIIRDESDSSIITFHVTKEISPLPGWAAANKWTGFTLLKEGDNMPIPEDKKEHLRTLGYSDELISQIEGGVQKASDALGDAGVESKEEGAADTEAAAEDENAEQTDTEDPKEGTDVQTDTEELPKEQTPQLGNEELKKEIALTITEIVQPMITALNTVVQKQTDLESRLTEMEKSDAEKIANTKEETPVRSIGDLVAQSLVGNKEARIHGNSKLANDGPKEKEHDSPQVTPIGFVNDIVASQNGSA